MDESIRPAPRRWPLILIPLIGGGLIAVVACAGCGVGGYMLFFSAPAVAGHWELTNPPIAARVTFDFRANGTGTIQSPGTEVQFEYTLSQDEPPILEWTITSVDQGGRFARKPMGKLPVRPHGDLKIDVNNVTLVRAVTERFRVTLINDVLILANQNGGPSFTLRKAR
jgi:hypothetical protein